MRLLLFPLSFSVGTNSWSMSGFHDGFLKKQNKIKLHMTWLPASTLQKNKRQNPKAISLASLNLTTFISTVFFLNCLNLLFFLSFLCLLYEFPHTFKLGSSKNSALGHLSPWSHLWCPGEAPTRGGSAVISDASPLCLTLWSRRSCAHSLCCS